MRHGRLMSGAALLAPDLGNGRAAGRRLSLGVAGADLTLIGDALIVGRCPKTGIPREPRKGMRWY